MSRPHTGEPVLHPFPALQPPFLHCFHPSSHCDPRCHFRVHSGLLGDDHSSPQCSCGFSSFHFCFRVRLSGASGVLLIRGSGFSSSSAWGGGCSGHRKSDLSPCTEKHLLRPWSKCALFFQGQLAGLCGNFDLKTINEMRTPENLELTNPQEFGSSWAAVEVKLAAAPPSPERAPPALRNQACSCCSCL